MQLVQSFLTQNPCYTCGTKLRRVCGLMLHSVGCPQPSADVFIRNWNKPTYDKAGVLVVPTSSVLIWLLPRLPPVGPISPLSSCSPCYVRHTI